MFYSLRLHRLAWQLFVLCFLLPTFCNASEISKEQDKKFLFQQFQQKLSIAKNESTELKAYLQNAIANMQTLETNFAMLKEQCAESNLNLKSCNESLILLQMDRNKLLRQVREQETELLMAKKKQKKALIVGVVVGSALAVSAGVTVVILASKVD